MKGILTDVTRCIGCQKCVDACTRENRLGDNVPHRWRAADGLSSQRFTSVVRMEKLFVRKQCRHCLEPACVSACPVGALRRTPEGAVVYDKGRCLGCRYCMMACPFGIPRYTWASAVPYVGKCTLCFQTRVSQGRQPACTEVCPEKATIFGERDALLDEARQRMADAPGRYLQEIIGEREVGGTAVLYLSPVPLNGLSLGNRLDDHPLPGRTLTAMAAVPPAFVGMGVIMGGVYWIIERRMRLECEAVDRERDGREPADKKARSSDDTTD